MPHTPGHQMEGSAGDVSAALMALAEQQAAGPGPIITPRSYLETLRIYFGTTNPAEAFAGFFQPGGVLPGMNRPIPQPMGQEDRAPASAYLDPIQMTGQPGFEETGGTGRFQFVVNPENGAMLFSDGTIVDPELDVAIIRPGEVGSLLWIRTHVPKWGEERVSKWRKTLFKQGYDVAKEGPVGDDLIKALHLFHQNRYKNGGEIVPMLTPEEMNERARAVRKESFGRSEARNAVRAMFQRQFQADPSDDELEEWSKWLLNEGTRIARRTGISGDSLQSRAFNKAEDRFLSDPAVKAEREETLENDYAGAALERFIAAFSQLG